MRYVFVIDINGNQLMPTDRPGHVRKLLRDGKAVVVRQVPFTIQLLYETTSYVQPGVLGADVGAKHVGLSVTGEKKEFFAAVDTLRTDVKGNVDTRRECRRTRRSRKTRHREARFDNRGNSTRKERYGPTTISRVAGHLAPIRLICSLMPIKKVNLEVGAFDTQKMRNPDIEGKEYQEGPRLEYENTRAYVLARDNYTCQKCHKKNVKLNVHHIIHRGNGGTNMPDNLITLCEDCHRKYHSGEIKLNVDNPKLMREPASMNVMRKFLVKRVKEMVGDSVEVGETYGYITKHYRQILGLDKTHDTDAFVITGNFGAERCSYVYQMKQLRCHNRQLHKMNPSKGGVRKSANGPRFMRGIRMNDIVRCGGQLYQVIGRRTRDCFKLHSLSGGDDIERASSRFSIVRSVGSLLVYAP